MIVGNYGIKTRFFLVLDGQGQAALLVGLARIVQLLAYRRFEDLQVLKKYKVFGDKTTIQ